MSLSGSLRTFFRITWRDRHLFLEAWLFLGIARFAIHWLPFRRIAPWLGKPQTETTDQLSDAERGQAAKVRWAIEAAARRTPWESACLAQAIAAKRMLLARGIPSTLYLGMARDADGSKDCTAHAWLRCGPFILTGAPAHLKYNPITSFGERE